jgi:L-lactate dehydrogenase (cytochrome)
LLILAVMRDEIESTMRLLGVTKLSQLGPHLVSEQGPTGRVFAAARIGDRGLPLPQLNTRAIDPLLADRPMFGTDEA